MQVAAGCLCSRFDAWLHLVVHVSRCAQYVCVRPACWHAHSPPRVSPHPGDSRNGARRQRYSRLAAPSRKPTRATPRSAAGHS